MLQVANSSVSSLHGVLLSKCVCHAQVPVLQQKQRRLQNMRSWTVLQLKENQSLLDSSWQVILLLISVNG